MPNCLEGSFQIDKSHGSHTAHCIELVFARMTGIITGIVCIE